MAEKPNLPGGIQRLSRLDHLVHMVHRISLWGKTLLELTPLGCIVSPDCFLSTSGRLIIHFVIRPLPAFLANQNHEDIHDDGHSHADQYFFHVGSISSAHSPGAVTLGTLDFQPTIPLAERAARVGRSGRRGRGVIVGARASTRHHDGDPSRDRVGAELARRHRHGSPRTRT